MKNMKKWLISLLAVVCVGTAAAGFAGCNGEGDRSNSISSSVESSTKTDSVSSGSVSSVEESSVVESSSIKDSSSNSSSNVDSSSSENSSIKDSSSYSSSSVDSSIADSSVEDNEDSSSEEDNKLPIEDTQLTISNTSEDSDIPSSSILMNCKLNKIVSNDEEYIFVQLGVSNIGFAWIEFDENIEYVEIYVENSKKEKLPLETIEGEDFNAEDYGYISSYKNGVKVIEYNNCVVYQISKDFLQGGTYLRFCGYQRYADGGWEMAIIQVNYTYADEDGSFYFYK